MEELKALFTRDNITLALSIFGSIGTVGTWLYNYIKTRKSFTVELNGYRFNPKGLLLHVQFMNKSTLSLSINEIAIKHNDIEYPCSKIPQKVLETTNRIGGVIVDHKEYYSLEFPINLPALCGSSGYLYFSSDSNNFPQISTEVTVIIRSNRGRAVERKLPLTNLLN